MYRAQFALCSLNTLHGLAHKLGVSIDGLSAGIAAQRLAVANERSVGRAAVLGCQRGLLYRVRTDRTIAVLRESYHSRVTAEKYVAAVYLLVVAMFFGYVLIHAAKISRLTRSVEVLSETVGESRSGASFASSETS